MITVYTEIEKSLQEVWDKFTQAEHVMKWNFASDDWHCPQAVNDLEIGKQFIYTMAAKDGSMSFDFNGTYTEVEPLKKIAYTIEDGRKVMVTFEEINSKIVVTEIFESEDVHPLEMQQFGWQSILNNFKNHVETTN